MRRIHKKKNESALEAEISLFPGVNITKVYKFKENYKRDRIFTEITSVSLNIKIENKWETIVYYDNTHAGVLHRHIQIVANNESDIPLDGFTKEGQPKTLLTWAMHDLTENCLKYIESFLERNPGIKDKIDIF